MTEEGGKLPHVVRVDSITNYQNARWAGGMLRVGPLFEDPSEMTAEDLERGKQAVLGEPLLVDFLVNREATVTGVN